MYSHRFYAVLTLILLAVGVGWLAINVSDAFPLGLFAALMICAGMFCAWEGIRRRDLARTGWLIGTVVLFTAGGIATPADAAMMMQLGADGVFVGSGIFKSGDPVKRAEAIVKDRKSVV